MDDFRCDIYGHSKECLERRRLNMLNNTKEDNMSNLPPMDDFSKSKVGDKVWSPMFGWGEVMSIWNGLITVGCNSGFTTVFTLDGRHTINGPQCLFYDEVEIISPPKPKEKKIVVIEDVTWLDVGKGSVVFPIGQINGNLVVWKDFMKKPPMEMTLEWEE